MAKKKVFVSFDYDNDKHYKLLLQAWDAHSNFDFSFNDKSITTPINSNEDSRIKAGITKQMNESTHCLIIVGKHTHRSDWVSWEIENANKLGLKIIAVKIDKSYKTPDALYGKDGSWAMGFKQDSIINAIEKQNTNRRSVKSNRVKFTKNTTCNLCGKPLTNPTSIRFGRGPTCRSKA